MTDPVVQLLIKQARERPVQAEREVVRKEEPRTQSRLQAVLPWLGGAGLGIAGLSELARRKTFTPDILRKMDAFQNAYKPGEDVLDSLARYAAAGSDLMRTRPAGMDAVDAVRRVRSLPGVPKHLKWKPEAEQHYREFQKGPLAAFHHLLSELSYGWRGAGQESAPPQGADFRAKLKDATQAVKLPGAPPVMREFLKGVVGTQTRPHNVPLPGAGFLSPSHTPAETSAILAQIHAPLTAALPAQLAKTMPPEQLSQFKESIQGVDKFLFDSYGGALKGAQKLNSNWGLASALLGGAGAAGLGYWGWNKWKQNKENKKPDDNDPKTSR